MRDYLTDLFHDPRAGARARRCSRSCRMTAAAVETGCGWLRPKARGSSSRRTTCAGLARAVPRSAVIELLAKRTGNPARQCSPTARSCVGRYARGDRHRRQVRRARQPRKRTSTPRSTGMRAAEQGRRSRFWRSAFSPRRRATARGAGQILDELNSGQGAAVDSGGYYRPTSSARPAAMRPSQRSTTRWRACRKPDTPMRTSPARPTPPPRAWLETA